MKRPQMQYTLHQSLMWFMCLVTPLEVGGGASGAIAIYTRRGNDKPLQPGNGLKQSVRGYTSMGILALPTMAIINENDDKKDDA